MKKTLGKGFVVFSRELAGELVKKGFQLLNMRPDKKDNTKNVYVFKDDEILREFVRSYTNK